MLTVTIPFPDSDLMPNRKNGRHWGSTQTVKRKAWDDAYMLALQAVRSSQSGWVRPDGSVPLVLTFCEPDKRNRDIDNLLAACKAQLDALATALVINDRQFHPITLKRGQIGKPGAVVIEVGA